MHTDIEQPRESEFPGLNYVPEFETLVGQSLYYGARQVEVREVYGVMAYITWLGGNRRVPVQMLKDAPSYELASIFESERGQDVLRQYLHIAYNQAINRSDGWYTPARSLEMANQYELVAAGYLEERIVPSPTDDQAHQTGRMWRITEAGARAINRPWPPSTGREHIEELRRIMETWEDEMAEAIDINSEPPVSDEDTERIETPPAIEIKTLSCVDLDNPNEVEYEDRDLAAHLAMGWEIVNISVISVQAEGNNFQYARRYITLRRDNKPKRSEPGDYKKARGVLAEEKPAALKGELVTPHGETLFDRVKDREDLPYLRAIAEHGVDEVIEMCRQRVRQVGLEAYEAARAGNTVKLPWETRGA